MKRLLKYLGYLTGTLIVALFALIIGGYLYFKNGLPNYSGEVQLTGIKSPITITRDKNALPHIIAQNINDAYFAIGYTHAQDRLWQMQMQRHIAMGKLSELVGKSGIPTDKFLRTLGTFKAAQASYPLLTQQTKTQLESYAAGVNAYLAEDNILPIEFTILQLDKPKPWRAIESAAWLKIMAWDLNSTWRKELGKLMLSPNFTPQQIADLYPPYPGDKPFLPPKISDIYDFGTSPKASLPTEIKISTILDNQATEGIGSNNWVLSGNLSQSGKPLLANDPHLALTAPALWYHAQIKAKDGSINAIGATMPGVPYVILGRNEKIAWGFTNTAPDAQDLYVEKITKKGYYLTPTGEQPLITREEIIKVKGADDVKITVRSTRHGPIISDQLPDTKELLGKGFALALRWTALDDDSTTLDAISNLATAQNWQEFKTATKYFKAPQQSIVFADTDGNIGLIAPGAVPIRRADNELYGRYPSPGWDAKYDWQGYIPFEQLPQRFNPQKGYIATANHKIVDDDYPNYITSSWTPPYRYNRIVQQLEKQPIHTMESMKSIQLEQYSLFLENIRPLLDNALNGTELENQQTKDAYTLLKNWDGNATVKSPEMLIISLWLKNLQAAILSPEFDNRKAINHIFLENILSNKQGMASWCDNNNCASLAATSLNKTVKSLTEEYGKNMQNWQWGVPHKSISKHRIFAKLPVLGSLFNIETPIGGGKNTTNVAPFNNINTNDINRMFNSSDGASLRHIFDLETTESSLYIHSSGQSGNIFSPHYKDYNPIWAKGEYLPMYMNAKNYEKDAIGTLTLTP